MARKKKAPGHEDEVGEGWLLPYSDLMTLLLAVFIVLFAVSSVDKSKAGALAESFQNSLGNNGIFGNSGDDPIVIFPNGTVDDDNEEVDATTAPTENMNKATENPNYNSHGLEGVELSNLNELKSVLDALFHARDLDSSVTVNLDPRGLVISLNNSLLFDSGSASVKVENEDTLIRIGNAVNTLDNYIRIEGHTDNTPITTAVFPSNWELSSARASNVVKLFIQQCNIDPKKLSAVGYGEYRPLADNSTAEGRAKNRRIDIIVLSQKYNRLEGN